MMDQQIFGLKEASEGRLFLMMVGRRMMVVKRLAHILTPSP
jgi:hypothetical protein